MTDDASQTPSLRVPPWILWLTWIYVGFFGLGVLFQVASIIIGANSLQRVTRAAAIVLAITQVTAVVAIKWLPEPQHEELPE